MSARAKLTLTSMALGLSSSQKQGLRKRGLKISRKAKMLSLPEGERGHLIMGRPTGEQKGSTQAA